jgi:hypothetical protein
MEECAPLRGSGEEDAVTKEREKRSRRRVIEVQGQGLPVAGE